MYDIRIKWMLPALLLVMGLMSACTVQPIPAQPGAQPAQPAADASMQSTVETLRVHLAAMLQVAPAAVTVVSSEAVEWPDSCLGAGGPAESCALVVTPGYRIVYDVDGQRYTYHTTVGPSWLRLVDGPQPNVGEPIIEWRGIADNGSCQESLIGRGGVAFGHCGLARLGGKFVSPARLETLETYAAAYAPFEAMTDWGAITFNGSGAQETTAEEQTRLARWAQLLLMEAASGVPMGGLRVDGPAEIGSDDTAKCATLTLHGDEATLFDCAGNVQTSTLDDGQLARWLEIQDRFAPFILETETETIDFTGLGAETSEAWQRAILAWARAQYAELSTGRTSAAGNTVLAWDLGPIDDSEARCMHLTVLAWGEAYAEIRPCAGGDVEALAIGWLETAELEQLDAWTTGFATLNAEQGYVAGTGAAQPGAEEFTAVESWAADVWRRIWNSGQPQQAGRPTAPVAECPLPAGDQQLFVNRDDGYCLLYPAGYVAESTGDGTVNLVLGSIMNHTDPRAGIEVTDAGDRTLNEIGNQVAADFAAGFEFVRTLTTVGGEEALVLDNLPGQDLNRRVLVLHGGRLYSFFFTPLGESAEARAAMDTFYDGVLGSFSFLDVPAPDPPASGSD